MTQISRDDIVKLAALSSLRLSGQEIDAMRGDIDKLLSYVEQLNELDTESVKPAYQVSGLENVTRKDVVEEGSITRKDLLALAPDTLNDQIKVPKVL